ncbi:MAG: FAD-dependent oxidoreductase [bacterium]|nr:FAD-dependent oxidoreductase [bacterium]
MINKSIWLKGLKLKKEKALKQNINTDILIIGGGITGMTTAYFLKDSSLKVTLVDMGVIGLGQTSKSTGKLTYLQGFHLNDIENIYDTDTVIKYIKSQKDAMEIVKNIIIDNNIKCNYESNNSFIFTDKKSSVSKIKNIEKILKNAKIKYKNQNNLPITFPSIYSIKVDDTAVFNPVKYLQELERILSDIIDIYENTRITNIEEKNNYYIAHTDKYFIKTKKIVFACHYPFFVNPYFFPFKTNLQKGYLCAAQIDKNKRFNAINDENITKSIRYYSNIKDYIVYVSEIRNIGSNIDNEKNYNNLNWTVKTNLSEKIKYNWFNFDIVTNDYLPIIGFLYKDNPNLLIGTGYNLWGMTNGTIAGKIICDLLLKKENIYKDLFDPNRDFNINKLGNYCKYNLINGYNFISSSINKNKDFYKEAEVKTINGIDYGVYTDKNNKKYKVYNKCPHMKCSLIFNEVDKTWDCPCHGSRFDINGKVIKGPSTYTISIDKKKK